MASEFDTLFQGSGIPVLMQALGDLVTYTPPTGSARQIQAGVSPEEAMPELGERGETVRATRRLMVRNDSTLGVASFQRGATVTIGGVAYAVEQWLAGDHGMARMTVGRVYQIERSNQGWRAEN